MSLRRFDGSNFKGQIDPIEYDIAPKIYKANEWQKLDRIIRGTIRMHLSESVYFTVQSCMTAFDLWKKLSTKMYLIRRLYNLRMKESDSV